MTTIKPINQAGEYKTGSLPATLTPEQITHVLGFSANVNDDPDKVTHSWGFEVDGNPCGIWDYCGERWSVYDPAGVLPSLFEKASHTPGPWHRNIKPASKYSVVWAGRNTHVAQVATAGLSEQEIEANINLIVAAPDLLSDLEDALFELEQWMDANPDGSDNTPAVIASARESIAKATGQQLKPAA